MLSEEDLARIVKDEVENGIRSGEILGGLYYILLNRKMYPQGNYDKEVEEGKRSPNDIYAYVDMWSCSSFDDFLFNINYVFSVSDIVEAYLRKMGFTIKRDYVVQPPTPNLKYFIDAGIERDKDHKPEYLVVSVYDIDSPARSFHIPQIVEQELGSQPREITADDFSDIWHTVAWRQPLLADYTYDNAYDILYNYYVRHEEKYKNEANKIAFAYFQLFPSPYRVCYEWEARRFVEINCLKIELRRFSS